MLRAALALAGLAAAGRGATAQPEGPAWAYDVEVAPALDRVSVRLCFDGFRPRRLVLASGGEIGHLEPATGEPRAGGFDPSTRSWAIDRPGEARCVSYEADLLEPSRGVGRGAAHAGAVVTEAGSWLLRPAVVPDRLRTTLRFRLPPGAAVSVPWARDPTTPDSYVLDATTWAYIGHVAFGRLARETFPAAGATFDVALLPGGLRAGPAGVRAWLEAAAEAVAGVFGRFPGDRVQAIVRPVPGGSAHGHDPVPFGSSWQGGGAALVMLLARDAPAAELPGEWVAVHEMVHLAMPVIEPADAWLSEGFATYYQEVLRVRAGFQSPAQAWERLEAGFRRGRASGGEIPLAEESRRMRETHVFHRVYWAGAALALLLDVELRRTTDGRRTLDDAMRLLNARHVGSRRPLAGDAVVAEVDAWAGAPVFSGLAAPALASADFPSVGGALSWLGVAFEGGRATLRDDAPGASHRRSLERGAAPGAGPRPSRPQ